MGVLMHAHRGHGHSPLKHAPRCFGVGGRVRPTKPLSLLGIVTPGRCLWDQTPWQHRLRRAIHASLARMRLLRVGHSCHVSSAWQPTHPRTPAWGPVTSTMAAAVPRGTTPGASSIVVQYALGADRGLHLAAWSLHLPPPARRAASTAEHALQVCPMTRNAWCPCRDRRLAPCPPGSPRGSAPSGRWSCSSLQSATLGLPGCTRPPQPPCCWPCGHSAPLLTGAAHVLT